MGRRLTPTLDTMHPITPMPTNTSHQPPHLPALLHQTDDDAPRPPELDTLASAQARRAWRSIETAADRVATGSRLQG